MGRSLATARPPTMARPWGRSIVWAPVVLMSLNPGTWLSCDRVIYVRRREAAEGAIGIIATRWPGPSRPRRPYSRFPDTPARDHCRPRCRHRPAHARDNTD